MTCPPLSLSFGSPDETAQFARRLAEQLHPGDVLLLSGPVGGGKTHFSRSVIQSLMDFPEDVPSPTFTLVQTYDTTKGEIWHADLYRLTDASEVEELGLLEAFDTAICLIEWPDRLGALAPDSALHLSFAHDADVADVRYVGASWGAGGNWAERIKAVSK